MTERLEVANRGEIEELHRRGQLCISDIERTDHRRLAGNGEAECLKVDRLVVANQPRIGLGQQTLKRLGSRNSRALFGGTRELRLRPFMQCAMNRVGER